jgi:hypothetical protein
VGEIREELAESFVDSVLTLRVVKVINPNYSHLRGRQDLFAASCSAPDSY